MDSTADSARLENAAPFLRAEVEDTQGRSMLRILFVTRAYRANAGGMERLSYELITQVSSLPNIQAHVLAYNGPRWMAPLFACLILPRALWAARQAEVIHLGDPLLSIVGWMIKILIQKPVAVTVHGLDITYPHWLYQLYLRIFFRRFELYMPISTHVATLLQRRHSAGTQVVTTPGIHDRLYDPSIERNRLAKLLGRPLDNTYILFTSGRLVQRKGHAWFIKHVLPQLPPHLLYVIAGDGPERKRIEDVAVQTQQTDRVLLLGRVSDEHLQVLYNTIDVFVQPNIPVPGDAEGFGIVLLEAASCNRPVFAARLEGITDAIHEGKNGCLLPAQDAAAWSAALNAHLSDPKPVVSRSYTLQTFAWPEIARQFVSHLETIVRR